MTTYKEAGVDVEKKENTISDIKKEVEKTFTPDVLGAATTFKFGGTISLKRFMQYDEPVLVLSTDGVGTKMTIAEIMQKWDTVGIDILNHSINDVLTSGAQALFFMDYIASSNLDPKIIEIIVKNLAKECKRQGIILAGGETAEMPGVYAPGKWELTGSVGGIVEKKHLIDGSKIKEGDTIIAIKSSGLHTNGYSLARKILADKRIDLRDKPQDLPEKVGELLLKPHKEYATCLLPLIKEDKINGLAHITGGGMEGNIPRVMPKGLGVEIENYSWESPIIFEYLRKIGEIPEKDMYRTFNMGVGMAVIIDSKNIEYVINKINDAGEKAFVIGKVVKGEGLKYV